VWSISIAMPGGSAREGVCIAAGIVAVEECEWRNKKGMCGGAGYVVSVGVQ
jgi:hypothetical protein